MSPIVVPFAVPAAEAFAYLADPRNRPEWQSSLRSIEDLHLIDEDDPTGKGVTWIDVTVVPGVRPRMRTTNSQPPLRWAETGDFGPFAADLTLTFEPDGEQACRVLVDFRVRALGLGPIVSRVSRRPVADDVRRAAKLLAQR